MPKVLSALAPIASPELMDLGPVVGPNIEFFGDQLACKIHILDLFAEIEAHAQAGTLASLPDAFEARFARAPALVDGVLCWDVFDYLDRKTGQWLARRVVQLVKPGGIVYGYFGHTAAELRHYTRFIVESRDTLRLRTVPATPVKRTVLVTRDIDKMFEGLRTVESVLLKSSTRETLFRKP
jgi:hypothetical protein